MSPPSEEDSTSTRGYHSSRFRHWLDQTYFGSLFSGIATFTRSMTMRIDEQSATKRRVGHEGSQRQSDNPPMSMSRDTYQQAQPRHHHSSSEYRASYSSDGQGVPREGLLIDIKDDKPRTQTASLNANSAWPSLPARTPPPRVSGNTLDMGCLLAQIRLLSTTQKCDVIKSAIDTVYPGSGWTDVSKRKEYEGMIEKEVTVPFFKHLHKELNCGHKIRKEELQAALEECQASLRRSVDVVSTARADVASLSKFLESEKSAYRNLHSEANREIDRLNARINELESLHIHSVNEIDAGLKPVTDQAFVTSFEEYHENVYQWCRQNFRGRKKANVETSREVADLLEESCHHRSRNNLPLSRLAELIVWDVLQRLTLRPSFPLPFQALDQEKFSIENLAIGFQRDDLINHQLKVDFWRSYTACLAMQSNDFDHAVEGQVHVIMRQVFHSLLQLVIPDEFKPPFDHEAFYDIIHPILKTAAQLKCQRGYFDVENVQVGEPFDENRMQDVSNLGIDDQTKQVVKVVLSDGIIKRRSYGEQGAPVGRACKARVIIGPEVE